MTNSEQPGFHEGRSPLDAGDERDANLSGYFGEIEDAGYYIANAPEIAEEFINFYIQELHKNTLIPAKQKADLEVIIRSSSITGRAQTHTLEVLLLLTDERLQDKEALFKQAMDHRISKELVELNNKLKEGLVQFEPTENEGTPKQIESTAQSKQIGPGRSTNEL